MGFTLVTPEEIDDQAEITGELASIEETTAEAPEATEADNDEVASPELDQAKKAYMEALKLAEDALVNANLLEAEMQGRVKAAKALRAECLEDLKRIHARGVDGFRENPPEPQEAKEEEAEPAVESYENWQAIPTANALKGVSGLGNKKLEALVDQYPTLGDLEGARGEASKSHEPFSSVLPKGIGRNLADAIENAMMNAISLAPESNEPEAEYENADDEVSEEAAKEEDEPEPEETEVTEEQATAELGDDCEWVDL